MPQNSGRMAFCSRRGREKADDTGLTTLGLCFREGGEDAGDPRGRPEAQAEVMGC